jgi:GT2 family glycosyltransferase
MPAFNGERFVGGALQSVTDAGDPGTECVVVDDGSTDGTRRIVESYRDALDLRVVDGPRAGNWVAATNAGVEASRGRYVTFLHQDDEWLPGRLGVLEELVGQVPDAALYVHAARFLGPGGEPLGEWRLPLRAPHGVLDGPGFVERLLVQNFVCVGAPLFRREHVVATGGLDEGLWYTADWDLWLRLAALGPVAYDTRPLVGFRIHPESQTSTRSADLPAFRRQLEDVFEAHFGRWSASRAAPVAASVERAARTSIEVNVTMAALSHRALPPVGSLALALSSLAGGGARRFARDSRVHERLGARLRALAPRGGGPRRLRSVPWR